VSISGRKNFPLEEKNIRKTWFLKQLHHDHHIVVEAFLHEDFILPEPKSFRYKGISSALF